MKKICSLLAISILSVATAFSQLTVLNLDATVSGQVVSFDSTNTISLNDNGGTGRYVPGDYYVTITSTCSPFRFFLQLNEIDIDCHDTLYIYDGADTTAPIRAKLNNWTGHREGQAIYVSPTNNTGMLTVRFLSVAGSPGGFGFSMGTNCGTPCEKVSPVLETKFYRTRNGLRSCRHLLFRRGSPLRG